MAGLCDPLSTLRRCPREHLRMTRGRCGLLLLHHDGLAPSTPCRSPGALCFAPKSGELDSVESDPDRTCPCEGAAISRRAWLSCRSRADSVKSIGGRDAA